MNFEVKIPVFGTLIYKLFFVGLLGFFFWQMRGKTQLHLGIDMRSHMELKCLKELKSRQSCAVDFHCISCLTTTLSSFHCYSFFNAAHS